MKALVCAAVGKVAASNCATVAADIIFLLDSSASIGSTNFDLMKNVVKDVINEFVVGPSMTQFGLISFRFAF